MITTEFTTSSFMLLRLSGKYEWCTVLTSSNTDSVQVLKLNNLIINCLLYIRLKGIFSHDRILILKDLRNCILCIISVWSLFCSVRV